MERESARPIGVSSETQGMDVLPYIMLSDIEDLSPQIARQAEDIEKERRVPGALLDDLRRIGCLRLLVPA